MLAHSSLVLEEKFKSRKGLITNISFLCSNSACKKSVLVSDPYSPEAAALNNASIVGARLAGCGLHAMEVITACIGMVPLLLMQCIHCECKAGRLWIVRYGGYNGKHRNGPAFYSCNVDKT